MRISFFLNLVFAFIFFTQNSAWAYGAIPVEKKKAMERFAKEFNSLSQTERMNLFKSTIKSRPVEDQKILEESLETVTGSDIPNLQMTEEGFKLQWEKKDWTILHVKGTVYSIDGRSIDFRNGKMAEASKEVETLFTQNKTSFLSFFIDTAHAADGKKITEGIALVLLMLAVIVGSAEMAVFGALAGVISIVMNSSEEKQIQEIDLLCSNLRGEIDYYTLPSLSRDQIKDVLSQVRKLKAQLAKNKKCEIKSTRFDCKGITECLNNLESRVEQMFSPVSSDNSERGQIKDVPESPKKRESTQKKVLKQ